MSIRPLSYPLAQSASKEVALELRSSITTEMELSATRIAFEDRLGITGRVVDADDTGPTRPTADASTGGSSPPSRASFRRCAVQEMTAFRRLSRLVRNRPIENARIRVDSGQASREATSTANGSFAVPSLGSGRWRVEVTAPGHVTESFAIAIPHRGELRGVRIDLVPVREKVFQLYRRVAEPILPNPPYPLPFTTTDAHW